MQALMGLWASQAAGSRAGLQGRGVGGAHPPGLAGSSPHPRLCAPPQGPAYLGGGK